MKAIADASEALAADPDALAEELAERQVWDSTLADGLPALAGDNDGAPNVIGRSTDRLQGRVGLHMLQALRPVLILDEPQNMESAGSRQALARLNPLVALRYSATHREAYNRCTG